MAEMFAQVARAILVLAGACLGPTVAQADELLRVGKAVPESIAFIPVDVGQQNGIFRKQGLDIDITAFGGGAKLAQAMTADGVDLGLGSGPEMAYVAKGAPVRAVAMIVGPPAYLVLLVRPDGGINTIADLKGRTVTSRRSSR